MQGYTIYKAGKAHVVQAEHKDVLICKSRRDAAQTVYDASGLLEEWSSKGHLCKESAE